MSESTQASNATAPSTTTTSPLLEVRDLAVSFSNSSDPTGPRIQAVAGVSMTIHPKQTLAVVGESGCGKSVTAMSSMQLIPRPPGRFDRGSIRFRGDDVLQYDEKRMLELRGKDIAMIFQEPMTSLNPVYTIGDQIMEAILLHQDVTPAEAVDIAVKAMGDVGIPHPDQRLKDYPHQFSGGMRQRVMIAMALACDPTLLLADEPTTALDVTIQAQILELLRELQRTKEMGIMLITHNLGVVAENADVVCVMYAGRVVEYAKVYDLFDRPLHPYTRGLFDSIPRLGQGKHRLTTVEEVVGEPSEFSKLPGHDPANGVDIVPWWPDPPGDSKPTIVPDRDEYVLYEIEPDRWVGCFRSPHLENHVCREPDLDFRKDDLL